MDRPGTVRACKLLCLTVAGCLAAWGAGCGLVPGAPAVRSELRQGPVAPPAMSLVEAVEELGRYARESRANLTVRMRLQTREQGERHLFATFFPPGLTLLQAALASPASAQRQESAWLQRRLLVCYVEVRSREPLASLRGDMRQVRLSDSAGHGAAALYMSEGSDSQQWTYRFYFDPLAFGQEQTRLLLTFQMPLPRTLAQARWRLSSESLEGMDSLPLLFHLVPHRSLRMARWAVLEGDRFAARQMLKELQSYPVDLPEARRLLATIETMAPQGPGEEAEPRGPGAAQRPQGEHPEIISLSMDRLQRAAEGGAPEELGHNPLADLKLRSALLARLVPAARAGLLSASLMLRAQRALRLAAGELSRGKLGQPLFGAILDLDRALASALAGALDGKAVGGKGSGKIRPVILQGGPAVSDDEVRRELDLRLVLANYGLVPQRVQGPPGVGIRRRFPIRAHLLELHPVLEAESNGQRVRARLDRRLGWGWVHPGLPEARYGVTFVDQGAAYWRSMVEQQQTLADLRRVARTLILREPYGPDQRAAELAMSGWVALAGDQAARPLLELVQLGPPGRGAAALRALAPLRVPEVHQAIHKAAASGDIGLRAAAMTTLGLRLLPGDRDLLRAALSHPAAEVAVAALASLLRAHDPAGLKQARAWLASTDRERSERLLQVLGRLQPPPAALAQDLLRVARRIPPTPALAAALVRVAAERCAPLLLQLFETAEDPALRMAVLQQVRGRPFERLLRRATALKDPALRRRAVFAQAQLEPPPARVLQQALKDPDEGVRLAAHTGLARLGRVESLLALGRGARGSCEERLMVLPTLCRFMDSTSRRRLLTDTLSSNCPDLLPEAWELVQKYHPGDLSLLRAALSHPSRMMRVQGALAALGLQSRPW